MNFRTNLVEVRHKTREAIFEKLDSKTGETITLNVSFLSLDNSLIMSVRKLDSKSGETRH